MTLPAAEQHERQHGNHHDAGADGAHRLQMDHRDTHQHADDVRDEPRKPHERAERVESMHPPLVMTHVRDRGPNGMHEHQHDSKQTGDRVDPESSCGRLLRDVRHDHRAGGIAHEAAPKQQHMAQRQRSRTTLPEHSEGVQNQRAGDGDTRHDQFDAHRCAPFFFANMN